MVVNKYIVANVPDVISAVLVIVQYAMSVLPPFLRYIPIPNMGDYRPCAILIFARGKTHPDLYISLYRGKETPNLG